MPTTYCGERTNAVRILDLSTHSASQEAGPLGLPRAAKRQDDSYCPTSTRKRIGS